MSFTRHYARRRRIDPWILALGMAALVATVSLGKAIFLFFVACGLFLFVLRPRTRRAVAREPTLVLLVGYALWSIGLSLWRGEPIIGNRQLVYALIVLAAVFVPAGIALVARPLDAVAAGARVGILLLFGAASLEFLQTQARVELGGNAAILAFLGAVAAVAARIEAERPPRFLPNSRLWAYVAFVPLLLSQTRAAWPLVGVIVVLDAVRLVRVGVSAGDRRRWPFALAAVAALLVAGIVAGAGNLDRLRHGFTDVERFARGDVARGSMDIRLAMLDAGLEVLSEHPVLGVGSTLRMEAAAQAAGESGDVIRRFEHLHNIFLDEALSNGLVGLALFVAATVALAVSVVRSRAPPTVVQAALLLVFLIYSYGTFHGVFLNEWMLMASFLLVAALLATTGDPTRRARWGRLAAAGGGAGPACLRPAHST